jgi:RimJ/RimL family protein N-acetyltransferase
MEVRPLTPEEAREIATWRYPGRYATYDEDRAFYAEDGYWAVHRDEELVGGCCFGEGARVPGVEEEPGTLDIGYGMRPDLMGRGLGREFVGSVVEFARAEFSQRRYRVVILEWNGRSRAAARSVGFEEDGTFESAEGTFVIMTRDAAPTSGHAER